MVFKFQFLFSDTFACDTVGTASNTRVSIAITHQAYTCQQRVTQTVKPFDLCCNYDTDFFGFRTGSIKAKTCPSTSSSLASRIASVFGY